MQVEGARTLKRSLSLADLLIYGLVFIGPTAPMPVFGIVFNTSRGMVPLVYLVGLAAMIFTARSYMKMARLYPVAGSAYAYASRSETRKLTDTAGRQADLDAALAIDPNDDFALMTRSAFYLYEKDFARGLADAEAVLAHTPADPQALNLRAILLGKLKRYDEQMAVLDAELKVNPENAQVLNSLCWARAVRNVELDKALDNCSAAIKASPLPGYYDSRALVNLRLGKLDDAQADYDTALSKRPDLAGSLYGRGLVKIRKGQVEDGKADIAKALAIDPHIRDDFKDMGLTPDQPAQP